MSNRIGTIEVRKQRGHITIQGMGQTGRGQKFIRVEEVLGVESMSDPNFKAQLAAGMRKIMPESLPLP